MNANGVINKQTNNKPTFIKRMLQFHYHHLINTTSHNMIKISIFLSLSLLQFFSMMHVFLSGLCNSFIYSQPCYSIHTELIH